MGLPLWWMGFWFFLLSVQIILKSSVQSTQHALSTVYHCALFQFFFICSHFHHVPILPGNSYLQKVRRQMTQTETCPEADMFFLN